MFGAVCGWDVGSETQIGSGGELGVEDKPAILPVQSTEHFLGAASTVDDSSINFIVTMFLEDVEDVGGFFVRMNSDLLCPYNYCERKHDK